MRRSTAAPANPALKLRKIRVEDVVDDSNSHELLCLGMAVGPPVRFTVTFPGLGSLDDTISKKSKTLDIIVTSYDAAPAMSSWESSAL